MITPVRDEARNLLRLAESLSAQTLRPAAWVVVDNGSTDSTPELVAQLAAEHSWMRPAAAPGEPNPRPGTPIVRAFHAGVAALGDLPAVVVKVDADVTLPASYFADLLRAFEEDPELGIAGGRCYEQEGGAWRPARSGAAHVRGAVRAYRRECLEQLLPLPERTGWDTADELQASVNGWQARVIPELRFEHHRAVGARDGRPTSRWRAKGEAAHYLGYRPLYLVLRATYSSRRDPAALAMIWGFVSAAARREPRQADGDARARLRQSQRLRHVRTRARETRAGKPSEAL